MAQGVCRWPCCMHRSARQRHVRAGRSASLERSSLRADCPAMLGLVAPSHNSLRSLRSLRSDTCDESDIDSRCARGHEPCASRRSRGALQPARTRLCGDAGGVPSEDHQPCRAAGGARRGRFVWRREAQAWGRRAQRASSTDSSQVSERRERSERSELCDATPGRASQCSRRAAATATA